MNFNNADVKEVDFWSAEPRKEGCTLSKVEFTEGKYLDFTFKDKLGIPFRHREFEPSTQDGDADKLVKSIKTTVNRVKHILRAFVDEATADKVGGDTWEQYSNNIMKAFPSGYEKIPVALKVVLNKANYACLPKVPAFISSESNHKDFKINPDYDKFVATATNAPDGEPKTEEAVF